MGQKKHADPFELIGTDLEQQAEQFEVWQEQNRYLVEKANKDGEIFTMIRREKAKEEMLQYMTDQVNLVYGGITEEDALDSWPDYKLAHKIDLRK